MTQSLRAHTCCLAEQFTGMPSFFMYIMRQVARKSWRFFLPAASGLFGDSWYGNTARIIEQAVPCVSPRYSKSKGISIGRQCLKCRQDAGNPRGPSNMRRPCLACRQDTANSLGSRKGALASSVQGEGQDGVLLQGPAKQTCQLRI